MSDDLKEDDVIVATDKGKTELEKIVEESYSDYEQYIKNAEKENEEQWLADMDDDTEIIDTEDPKEINDLG